MNVPLDHSANMAGKTGPFYNYKLNWYDIKRSGLEKGHSDRHLNFATIRIPKDQMATSPHLTDLTL